MHISTGRDYVLHVYQFSKLFLEGCVERLIKAYGTYGLLNSRPPAHMMKEGKVFKNWNINLWNSLVKNICFSLIG